jgi:uncharacterized protein YeaO (DUF488 family)
MNLKPGTLKDITAGKVSRRDGYLVVVTRYYPRFLRRDLIDEYVAELAPSKELLKDYKEAEHAVGHDAAFAKVNYVKRFKLSPKGFEELTRLKKLSAKKPVYLFCHCEPGQFCHRDILISLAKET